jgi:hypothetical protein
VSCGWTGRGNVGVAQEVYVCACVCMHRHPVSTITQWLAHKTSSGAVTAECSGARRATHTCAAGEHRAQNFTPHLSHTTASPGLAACFAALARHHRAHTHAQFAVLFAPFAYCSVHRFLMQATLLADPGHAHVIDSCTYLLFDCSFFSVPVVYLEVIRFADHTRSLKYG